MKRIILKSPHLLFATLLFLTAPVVARSNGQAVTDLRINPLWLDDGSLEFTRTVDGEPKRLRIDPETGDLINRDGDGLVGGRHTIANPRRSRGGGESTDVQLENRTELDLELVWLDLDGERRAYGRIAPGERRSQHTFTGHAWILVNDAQRPVLGFRATAGEGPVVIDDASLEAFEDIVATHLRRRESARS